MGADEAAASPTSRLVERLWLGQAHVLAFLGDQRIPFGNNQTNNQAERDLRLLNVQQKVSDAFRSVAGTDAFSRRRGSLSTLNQQGVALLAALETLFMGQALYPSFA